MPALIRRAAPANSTQTVCNGGTAAGATCTYACNTGYSPSAGASIVLACNGTDWLGDASCIGSCLINNTTTVFHVALFVLLLFFKQQPLLL